VAVSDHRVRTVIGWISAVVMLGLTILILAGAVYGYVLAVHHRLPPNGVFGVRDTTTLSCLPAWYAAQDAGFHWFLFLGCPILVLNVAFGITALLKRRSPWDVHAASMATLLLVGVVTVIAGVHADSVARPLSAAATCYAPPLQQFGPSFHAPERLSAFLVAGLFVVVQSSLSVALTRNWSRAAAGRLQRNEYFGIRTPSTLRSEQTWVAGNRAALRLLPLFLVTNGVTVVALFAAAASASTLTVVVIGTLCFVIFFALTIYAAVFGSRAARSVDGVTR
jgi:hypothetical protein